MQYCVTCEKNVSPTKKFSFGWFMLNCLWIIGSGVYILYWILKTKTCPICNGRQLEGEPEVIVRENDTPIQLALSKTTQLANSSAQSANETQHKQKLTMRQKILQQTLKSAEHMKESKDVAEFQVNCEASTAARTLAAELWKLEKEQKKEAQVLVNYLSKVKIS